LVLVQIISSIKVVYLSHQR